MLILENYSTHKYKFIKKNCLNAENRINILASILPHLNPIEQIWRQMKRQIKNHHLESKEFLEEITINTYNEVINRTNVYKNWYETYILKVW